MRRREFITLLSGAPLARASVASEPRVFNVKMQPYSAAGDGVTDDTTSIQTAINDASAIHGMVYFPKGTYLISRVLTTGSARWIAFQGEGCGNTIILTANHSMIALIIGPGSVGSGSKPGGWLRDMTISGPSSAPTTQSVGVQLNGMRQFICDSIEIGNFDIGFDAIRNCFGSSLNNCRIGFGQTVNVGINLRAGVHSGNDLFFTNNWVDSAKAAVSVSPGFTNARFYGGQYSSSPASADDTAGVITFGKDYTTGTVGGATMGGLLFEGIDFEPVQNCWCIRGFADLSGGGHVRCCTVLANHASPGLGFLKQEYTGNTHQNKWWFEGLRFSGKFTNAALISNANSGSSAYISESGLSVTSPCTANGVNIAGDKMLMYSLLVQSALTFLGRASYRAGGVTVEVIGGLMLRNNGGKLECSSDGSNWSAVGTRS
jgi:hypothetical protein